MLSHLVLDTLILFVTLLIALRENAPRWPRLGAVCLATAVSNVVWKRLLYGWIGVLTIVPLLLSAAVILLVALSIRLKQTAWVLAVFVAIRTTLGALEFFFR